MAKNKAARRGIQVGPGGGPSPRPAGRLPARALHLVPESLLTLSTTAPVRPTITIDKLAYRIAFYEDFVLWQHIRLEALTGRLSEFDDLAVEDEAQEITPEQWAELEVAQLDTYAEIVRIVLPDLPEPTLLALTLPQRRAIVRAFFAATGARTAAATPIAPETADHGAGPGADSSPGSPS